MASPRTVADFEVVFTTDGSPSLRIVDSTGYFEKMHHSEGALSESLYIYGDALEEGLKRHWPLSTVSLGLGLGYNEMIVATKAIQHGVTPQNAKLYSFESEPVLIEAFSNWFTTGQSAFGKLYEQILQQLSLQTQIDAEEIRRWLKDSLQADTWQIRTAFPEAAQDVRDVSCVFYDAFSNKMSPELWSEEVLTQMIEKMCAKNCVFSTYAATGALKRALKNTGFRRIERPGFANKRESTFALREASL